MADRQTNTTMILVAVTKNLKANISAELKKIGMAQ